MDDLGLNEFLAATSEAVIAADEQGVIVFANSGAQRVFGYAPSELAGKNVELLVPRLLRDRHAAHRLEYVAAPKPVDFMSRQGLSALRKDGTAIWVDISLTPLKSHERLLVICIVSDATERIKLVESIRNSEIRFRSLVEATTDWIWEVDTSGAFTYASPRIRDLLGFAPQEVIGRTLFDLMTESDAARTRGLFQRAVVNQLKFENWEHGNVGKDGRIVTLETSGAPAFDHEGTLLGFRGIARDVTNRKQIEHQLRGSQRTEIVARLAGALAHDLNTLVTLLTGYADMAYRHLEEDNTALLREDIASIKASVDRAEAFTKSLITIGRKQAAAPRPLQLNSVVSGLENVFRDLLREKVNLLLRLDPAVLPILADPNQLEQAIINLVINASDAMPSGGSLAIETSNVVLHESGGSLRLPVEPGKYAVLAVQDTGSGMDQDMQSHLFEPFFTTKAEGTGLGLYATFDFIKQGGGNISVESESGKGTTFRIYFKTLSENVKQSSAGASRKPGQGRTVLVVEDEDAIREMIAKMLRQDGYAVLEAGDGEQAIAIASRHGGPLDAVVTDVLLPKKDGLEVARQVLAARPDLHLLFISGHTQSPTVQYGIIAAGFEFLPKPFTADTLSRRLSEIFQSSPARLQVPLEGAFVLIASSDEKTAAMVPEFLRGRGCNVLVAKDGIETLQFIDRNPSIALVFLDAMLTSAKGTALLAKIRAARPRLAVVMFGGGDQAAIGTEALKLGAFDYLPNLWDTNRLDGVIVAALAHTEYEKRSWWRRIMAE